MAGVVGFGAAGRWRCRREETKQRSGTQKPMGGLGGLGGDGDGDGGDGGYGGAAEGTDYREVV